MNYKHMSVSNDSLWDAFRLHNEFQSTILNEQQGELSWRICGCRHSMCHYMWRWVTDVEDKCWDMGLCGEVVSTGVSSVRCNT